MKFILTFLFCLSWCYLSCAYGAESKTDFVERFIRTARTLNIQDIESGELSWQNSEHLTVPTHLADIKPALRRQFILAYLKFYFKNILPKYEKESIEKQKEKCQTFAKNWWTLNVSNAKIHTLDEIKCESLHAMKMWELFELNKFHHSTKSARKSINRLNKHLIDDDTILRKSVSRKEHEIQSKFVDEISSVKFVMLMHSHLWD